MSVTADRPGVIALLRCIVQGLLPANNADRAAPVVLALRSTVKLSVGTRPATPVAHCVPREQATCVGQVVEIVERIAERAAQMAYLPRRPAHAVCG